MRFTESRKKTPWLLLLIIIIAAGILSLGFCQFKPVSKTVQKTIVYEVE